MNEFEFNNDLEPHVLTDKPKTKDVPCRTCKRRCTVTTFATPSKVSCNECKDTKTKSGKNVVRSIVPDPYTATNLMDSVRVMAFRKCSCPFDPTHEMVIKCVTHSDQFGPNNKSGDTVMYQCRECMAVVQLSNNHRVQYIPQNLKLQKGPSSYESTLGKSNAA